MSKIITYSLEMNQSEINRVEELLSDFGYGSKDFKVVYFGNSAEMKVTNAELNDLMQISFRDNKKEKAK